MNVYEEITAWFTRKQQEEARDFESLVTAHVAGGKKAPSGEQIAARLKELGRTPVEFKAKADEQKQR